MLKKDQYERKSEWAYEDNLGNTDHEKETVYAGEKPVHGFLSLVQKFQGSRSADYYLSYCRFHSTASDYDC